MNTVTSEIDLKVSAGLAYRAFTNSTALREWLCDVATVAPHPRGRMYLWWNGDFYSSGHYLALEENQFVKFRWFSNIDPEGTEVSVTFDETGGTTHVVMAHSVPEKPGWENKAQAFRENWDSSLENLKSVLETGIDQRIASQPMIGVLPGDFTAEQAEHLQVPVKEGFRLDGVVEGMGAAKAGLLKDDVIVAIDGKPVMNDFNTFQNAIAGKKGGDAVEVTYYRGRQQKTVSMELTKRPMVDVPFNISELVAQARVKTDAALAELEKSIEGISDAQAAARPAANEWSALDILAHLLQGERFNQFWIVELSLGYERQADDWGGNSDAQARATVSMYPTVDAMLAAVRSSFLETLSLVSNLPVSFEQNRASFYRVGNLLLQNDFHIYSHIPQIKAAIAAA